MAAKNVYGTQCRIMPTEGFGFIIHFRTSVVSLSRTRTFT